MPRNLPITANPLETRTHVQEAVRQICDPLRPFFSEGKALVDLGATGATYPPRSIRMEAFARPLWGLVPLAAGGGDAGLWDLYTEGLRQGPDPEHPEYWGDLGDKDQRAVEMAPIALGLMIARDRLWDPLTEHERKNLAAWMDQINHKKVAASNWKFFVVLVNAALRKLGLPYDRKTLEKQLADLDTFYLGDGWYSDGKRPQMDYYNPFALHFYGLIYATLMADEDPERARTYRERAALFAQQYIHWFAADGASIPFGRSLIYRFGASAFWSALAFADVEALPWGVVKGLVLRNLRWWFRKPIFTPEGLLTLGYAYPNLCMTESYNGPGAPYWALKAFLCLAVPENHPFWQSGEAPLPALDSVVTQTHPHMVIQRSDGGRHVVALQSGQWQAFSPSHTAAKSSKFAYSTAFAFSVPRENVGLSQGAYDSMLALHAGDKHYRVRRECESFDVTDNLIHSVWKPWDDVTIDTWLLPAGNAWHVRVHRVETPRPLSASEGGFAIASGRDAPRPVKGWKTCDDASARARFAWGCSGIRNLLGARKSEMITAKPNTNLMESMTVIPTLTGSFDAGTHWLACAVAAGPDVDGCDAVWDNPPACRQTDAGIRVEYQGNVLFSKQL